MSSNPNAMRDWLLASYIRQDLLQYSEAAVERVKAMVGEALGVLRETYLQFQSFPVDVAALASLKDQQSRKFVFESFV